MAISLSSALALAALLQGDSAATLRALMLADSTDGQAWLALGRGYAERGTTYHRHPDTAAADTSWARAVLDSADDAFGRAVRLLAGTPAADSARVLRLLVRNARALLAWELHGVEAASAAWGGGEDARPPPALEELGENLLRGCPRSGILLTAGPVDGGAAAYMRFVRRLRPDLLVIPLADWRADEVLRRRVAGELQVERPPSRGAGEDAWLRLLVERRPVCATMALDQPPRLRGGPRWRTRPLLWVAGPRATADRVAPREFVFAALRLALDQGDTWAEPVAAIYRRAARDTRALCEPLGVYGLKEEVGCR